MARMLSADTHPFPTPVTAASAAKILAPDSTDTEEGPLLRTINEWTERSGVGEAGCTLQYISDALGPSTPKIL